MTEADLQRIEERLGVTLPRDYRHLLLNYPVRFSAGTTDQPLWDDADALVSQNEELRRARKTLGGCLEPIPSRYFCIGEDGGGWQFLIDLAAEPSMVHVMAFQDVEQISAATTMDGQPQTLNAWFHEHLLELKNDGVDITSEIPPGNSLGWGCILGGFAFCLAMAIAIVLMSAGVQYLRGK